MEAQLNDGGAQRTSKAVWALVAVSLAIYLTGNWRTAFLDRDEPRFAQAAREMIATGDWVVPHFNGEVRYDKPVLSYYFIALGMKVFGENEFGARVFNAIFGAMSVLALFLLAKSILAHERKALLAAAMLAGAPTMVVESKLCTADALLVFLVLLSFCGLWKIYEGPCGNGWKVLFWSALALAVLDKGPVAIAAVFGAVFFLVAISRDRSFLGRMAWPWGVPLFVLILLPWVMAVQERTNGDFIRTSLQVHVFERAESPNNEHWGIPGYYLFTAFLSFFPWAFFLPGAVWDAVKGLRDKPKETFLLSWMAGLWVALELVQTKMIHYSLPVFPAAAMLAAQFVTRAETEHDRRLLWGITGAAAMSVVLAVGMPSAAEVLHLEKAVAPLAAAGAVLLIGTAAWAILAKRWSPLATGAAVATVLAWQLILWTWGAPATMNYSPSKGAAALVAHAREKAGPDAIVGLFGYREASLVFYVNGAKYADRPSSLEEFYAPDEPDILVVSSKKDRELTKLLQDTDFEYEGWVEGFNFPKGEHERLSVWLRPRASAAETE